MAEERIWNGSSWVSVTDEGHRTASDPHAQYPLLAGRAGGQTIIGGSGVTDAITIQGTSGNGTASAAAIVAKVGNAGATTALTVLNNGYVGLGNADPTGRLDIKGAGTTTGLTLQTQNSAGARKINILDSGAVHSYNTYTDASNYERGIFDWQTSSNVLTIGAQAAGTGTLRDVAFAGASFRFPTDASRLYLHSSNTTSYVQHVGAQGTVFNDETGHRLLMQGVYGLLTSNESSTFLCELMNYYYPTIGSILTGWKPNYDAAATKLTVKGGSAFATATTNLIGADVLVSGGAGASSSAGNAHAGNVRIQGGTGYGTGHHGYVYIGDAATAGVSFFNATPAAQIAHVADASTAHALNATFSDTEVETALNNLGTKINSILTTLEAFGFHATA